MINQVFGIIITPNSEKRGKFGITYWRVMAKLKGNPKHNSIQTPVETVWPNEKSP